MDINALMIPFDELYEDFRSDEAKLRRRKRKRFSAVATDGQIASSSSVVESLPDNKVEVTKETFPVILEEKRTEVVDSPHVERAASMPAGSEGGEGASPIKKMQTLEPPATETKGKELAAPDSNELMGDLLEKEHPSPLDVDLHLGVGNPGIENASSSRQPLAAVEERASPKNVDLSLDALPTRYAEEMELMRKNLDNYAHNQFGLRSEVEMLKAQLKSNYDVRLANVESLLFGMRLQMENDRKYFEESMRGQFKTGGARMLSHLFEIKKVTRDVLEDPVVAEMCKGVFVEPPDV